jgi:hypothetical protein
MVPTCTLSAADQDELESRAAAYRTDGARVTAAPSAGPGAAYFHNASQALAAPTTSWVRTVDPDLGAGSFGDRHAVAPARPLAAAANPSAAPPPSAIPPTVQSPAEASTPSPAGTAMPEVVTEQTEPQSAPVTNAVPASPTARGPVLQTLPEAALPAATSSAGGAGSSSVGQGAARPAEVLPLILWLAIGTPIAALLVFLAVRAFASRVLGH